MDQFRKKKSWVYSKPNSRHQYLLREMKKISSFQRIINASELLTEQCSPRVNNSKVLAEPTRYLGWENGIRLTFTIFSIGVWCAIWYCICDKEKQMSIIYIAFKMHYLTMPHYLPQQIRYKERASHRMWDELG